MVLVLNTLALLSSLSSVYSAYRGPENTRLTSLTSPRHFSHQDHNHHHQDHQHYHQDHQYQDLQSNRDPSSNFNLEDGVSSVLSQLLPSCSSEKQFRALNLDITCPPSLPTVSSCHCLTKNQRGDLMSKTPGQIDYQGRCLCETSRYQRSSSEHVITRSSCCTTVTRTNTDLGPLIAANIAEEPAGIVYCPPESPYKTKYRSTGGLVSCGAERMVGKCLCLADGRRRLGRVVGDQCLCKGGKKKSGPGQVVVRAVCCSDDSEEEGGETVITQHWR